jgi:hypothetical protein
VTRGAESTTPVAHTARFTIQQVVSAGGLGGFLQSANNLSDVASILAAQENLTGIYGSILSSNGNLGECVQPRAGFVQDRQLSSGTIQFTVWRALLTQSAQWIVTQTGSTAASGLTVAQIGIYSVPASAILNTNQNVTVTRLAMLSDATMWQSQFAPQVSQLSSSASITAGNYYALAVLTVGTTPPSIYGLGNLAFMAPYLGFQLAGQSSLPSTLNFSTVADPAFMLQAAVSAVNIS